MNISLLDGEALHEQTLRAAKDERRATLHLLECLHFIEVREIHLARGFASLFQYVHECLGYSESQTSERISAMRLMYRVPEIRKEIERGSMTLTAAAKVASHAKRMDLGAAEVARLLPVLQGQSTRQIEKELLSREVQAGVTPQEKLKPVSATQTQISLTLNDKVMKLLEEARDLDHNPAASVAEVLEKALKLYVSHKKKSVCATPVLRAPEVKANHSVRYIPRAIRREVWQKAQGRCEFTHANHRCNSTRSLTIEHVIPFFHGGTHDPANLKLYCWSHNQHTAKVIDLKSKAS